MKLHPAFLFLLCFALTPTKAATNVVGIGEPYEFVDLGVLTGDEESSGVDLNESGTVVVTSFNGGESDTFVWEQGTRTVLAGFQDEGLGPALATAIGDSGTVAGWAVDINGLRRAVIWRNGVIQDLGDLTDGDSFFISAGAINASDTVVGEASSSSAARGFLWDGTNMNEVLASGTLRGLNDAGDVVGYNANTLQPLIVTEQGTTQMGHLQSGAGSFGWAADLNASRQVVGTSAWSGGRNAYVWTSAAGITSLGDFPGGREFSQATSINDAGWVVGTGEAATGMRAFIWNASDGLIDLNTCVDSSADGYVLTTATAINNQGEIVGTAINAAGKRRAFLLRKPIIDLRLNIAFPSDTLTLVYPTLKPIGNLHLHAANDIDGLTNLVHRIHTIPQQDIQLMTPAQRSMTTFIPQGAATKRFYSLLLEP